MLAIKDLSIATRQPILDNFSFEFKTGNLYGIVATNGSGKTSFFRGLMGLIPVKSGQVYLNKEINFQKEVFYYESSEWLDKNLSGFDYLTFVKKEWNSTANIENLINLWEMEEYIKLPIKKYSLGMKQKLIILMYFVSEAQCLLMDEITNGLDEKSRNLLFSMLLKYKNNNKLIILSSHYKEDIEEYCDYILSIQNLKVVVDNL